MQTYNVQLLSYVILVETSDYDANMNDLKSCQLFNPQSEQQDVKYTLRQMDITEFSNLFVCFLISERFYGSQWLYKFNL